jgi:Rieske Fe-S protein
VAGRGPRRARSLAPGERAGPATRALLDRIRADTPVTRRDYLRVLVTVSAGLAAARRGGRRAVPPPRRRHGRAGQGGRPPGPGQAVAFRYPGHDDRALAVRLPDGRLVGYSAVCTHLACAVLWRQEDGHLECPCHNGVFDPATARWSPAPPAPAAQGAAAPGRPRDLGRGDRLMASRDPGDPRRPRAFAPRGAPEPGRRARAPRRAADRTWTATSTRPTRTGPASSPPTGATPAARQRADRPLPGAAGQRQPRPAHPLLRSRRPAPTGTRSGRRC